MKTTISRSSVIVLIAGALVAPASLAAQVPDSSSSRTHVVRRGDTLWKLAERYLGSGYRWRDILALNARVVDGPTQLEVGRTLRIPSASGGPASRTAPRGTSRTAVRPAQRPFTTSGRTIFYGRRSTGFVPPAVEPDSSGGTLPDGSVVRAFEAAAAPFVVDDATFAAAGRCTAPGALPPGEPARPGVSLSETFEVQPPAGVRADSAARFVLARLGPMVDAGQVVIPTAVVRLGDARGGTSAAEIVAQFEVVSCDAVVLPLDIPAVPEGARPAPVTGGPTGKVLWIAGEALLPTLQHYLIVDLGSRAGLQPGDQIAVLGDGGDEAAAAVATIVRVSPQAASAVVIDRSRGAIAAGARVRVSARMP
jgi:hypothetical protein